MLQHNRRSSKNEIIEISGVRVEIENLGIDVVDDFSLSVEPGEIIGLVGESGSGKTTAGLAVLSHARRGLKIAAGKVMIERQSVLELSELGVRDLRRHQVAYVPQDPGTALNPALKFRTQLAERLHPKAKVPDELLFPLLDEVKLPATSEFLDRFPHQMSGGQQQRVAIAVAFAVRPALIIMDEPTTGLDVTTQAHVLQTIRKLCKEHRVASIYVTHDLAVVSEIADRVAVMYSGRIVEMGPTREVLFQSRHPYSRALVQAVPQMHGRSAMLGIPGQAPDPTQRPSGCAFSPRCPLADERCYRESPPVVEIAEGHLARCFNADRVKVQPVPRTASLRFGADAEVLLSVKGLTARYGAKTILHNVDFQVARGECVALVGESGSGKTTLSRSLAGLHREWSGTAQISGSQLPHAAKHRDIELLRRVQYVFQNPYASLNPRRTIGDSCVMAYRQLTGDSEAVSRRRMLEVLDRVALSAQFATRLPREMSGGQRQRAAIARALIVDPDLMICDEVTSALDVSVQAVIVDLLTELQRDSGLTMLFVTHNLPLVCNMSQRVIVLRAGEIVENGTVEEILHNPKSDETRRLMSDAPDFIY